MSAFVGRTRELAALDSALDRALSGQGGIVFLKGDAGAGKSTLVHQFLTGAALRRPELRVLTGECSEQFGAGEPYQPFVEAFRGLVREPEREQPAGRRRLRDIAKQVAPYWLQVIPVAGDLIAAAVSTAGELRGAFGATAGAEAPNEETLFFQYTELLLAAAEQQPMLLFLDDLHWADRASVGLLGHIGRKLGDQRILVLGTYRDADVVASDHPLRQARLELQRYGAASEIALEPLDAGALAEFVREELGAPAAPDLLHWLVPRAGSTPLFFGELLRWLGDQGLLQQRQGEWTLARIPAEPEIPRTAEAIIEKRLLRLDPDSHRIIEYASVIGAEFDSVSLAKLLAMDELELEEALERLARVHQLLRLEDTRELPTGDFASIYQFSHSLVQHAVHKNVQGKRRILLHRKVAEILEAAYPDTDVIARRLAVHCDEGRLGERAYAYALQAADVSARLYAHWSILELLDIARRNAPDDAGRLEVLDRAGESNRLLGRFAEALELFAEAEGLAAAVGDHQRALGLDRKRLLVERDRGARPADELLRQLEALECRARELGATTELCQILWLYRRLPGALADADLARRRAEEARDLVATAAEPVLQARAAYELGIVLAITDRSAEAIPCFEDARQRYEALGDRDHVGMCQNGAGIACIRLGDHPAAVAALQQAAATFDQLGDPVNEAAARNNLGVLLTRMGDFEGAEENLREAVRLARRMTANARLLHPLQNLAELSQARGDPAGARERWTEMLAVARETGFPEAEAVARSGLGLALLDDGDAAGATEQMETAGRLLDAGVWDDGRETWQMLAAAVAIADGDRARGTALLLEGARALEVLDPFLSARFHLAAGEAVLPDDPAGAATLIATARETFARLGAEPLRRKAEALLATTGS